jgi:hypothetical protein
LTDRTGPVFGWLFIAGGLVTDFASIGGA